MINYGKSLIVFSTEGGAETLAFRTTLERSEGTARPFLRDRILGE
jgi:hypothetical protein